ncbi:hypothetical protein [Streptomyces sp. JH34]|uniref:hypothetical protein n=1 Tax=Streptomyces sp. JH34 TaxID=2793633 RepID=UPI0023F7F726|nr:hypothetical protein [Streptomyces sp. JH34]MDF6019416.1 hypothetical protein [Streptomyces sp. JH34]
MSMSAWRRVGVSLTLAVVVAGVAGCQGGEKNPAAEAPKAGAPVTEVLTAAYKKTAAAKSAKVHMTLDRPDAAGGGTMEMDGTMGWGPTVMDMTMKGEALQAAPNAPEQIRVVMANNVMYMDMGASAAAEMDGKRWMKMDLGAIAGASGNAGAQQQMSRGLGGVNQDPAQQIALLLESPDVKRVGAEKLGGVDTQHYKGSISFDEMLKANDSLGLLTQEQRKSLLANGKRNGITGYDTEMWVDEDGYPRRMDVGVGTAQGEITMVVDYSDYGTGVAVEAPPAGETFDLMEMLKGIGQAADPATT